MKRRIGLLWAEVWLVLLILYPARRVMASAIIEDSRTGSLTISYRESNDGNEPVQGAVFSVLRVAIPEQVVGDLSVSLGYRSLLFDSKKKAISIGASTKADSIEAAALSAYKSGSVSEGLSVAVKTDVNGRAVVYGLLPGIYLVTETAAAKEHLKSAPFLVSIPFTESSEETGKGISWSYAAYAEPKPFPCGDLVISKYLRGNGITRKTKFHFQVLLSASGRFSYRRSDGKKGKIKSGDVVVLCGGQSITISTIPEGTSYRVSEKEDNANGYTTTKSGYTGKISRKKAARAIFVNQLTPGTPKNTPSVTPGPSQPPDINKITSVRTGDSSRPLLWGALLVLSGVILIYVLRRLTGPGKWASR